MKKISQNLLWMSAANIVSGIFNALIFIFLAKRLGAGAFGKFSFAQSLVFFIFNFIDLGLSIYGIREIAKDKERLSEYVSNIVSLRLVIASILYVVCTLILLIIPESFQFKVLMLLMLLLLFSSALATEWAFQGIEKMRMVFISFSVTTVLQFVSVMIFVKGPEDLWVAPLIIFLGALPIIFTFLRLLNFKPEIRHLDLISLKNYFRSSIVIWAISLFAQVYNGLDIVILGFFRSAQVVGYFSVARRLVAGLILFCIFLAGAYLPRLSATFKLDFGKFREATRDFIKLMFILGFSLLLVFYFLGDKIIILLIGRSYLPALPALRILVLGAVWVIFNLPFSTGLIASGHEKEVLKQTAASAFLSITLNFILIPQLGMEGAAVSFFFAEALGLAWILVVHYKKIGIKAIA